MKLVIEKVVKLHRVRSILVVSGTGNRGKSPSLIVGTEIEVIPLWALLICMIGRDQ